MNANCHIFIGLFAAKLLDEEGLDVVVLEANDRVGGRVFTLRVSFVSSQGMYLKWL